MTKYWVEEVVSKLPIVLVFTTWRRVSHALWIWHQLFIWQSVLGSSKAG